LLLLYVYELFICLEIGNNLSHYKVVFSMNMSHFYFSQWRFLICQWNTRCNDTISINRSINLIIDYFSKRLIDYNRLIVAVLMYRSLRLLGEGDGFAALHGAVWRLLFRDPLCPPSSKPWLCDWRVSIATNVSRQRIITNEKCRAANLPISSPVNDPHRHVYPRVYHSLRGLRLKIIHCTH